MAYQETVVTIQPLKNIPNTPGKQHFNIHLSTKGCVVMVTYDHDLSKNRGKFQKQGWKLTLNNCCLKITTPFEPSYEKVVHL